MIGVCDKIKDAKLKCTSNGSFMVKEYIEKNALLKDIEELKKSPWYNDDYGFETKQVRHEAVSIVVDLCIKKAPVVYTEEE